MKKRSLFVAAYLAMGAAVMFTSCSNDDDIMNGGIEQGVEDAQVLTLNIASSGDGLSTRAGRPLYSNEADQKIDNIALYFVNADNKVVLKKLVSWAAATDYDDNRGHGKELEIALKGNQKLAGGAAANESVTYTVYAVGYSNNSEYTFTPTVPANDKGAFDANASETWGQFQVATTEPDAEEIFAGSTTVAVANDGSFNLSANGKKQAITLHRQVAGITGYFSNIPVRVNDKLVSTVRLVSVAKNTVAQFGHFYSDFTENPNNKPEVAKFIVNGTTPAAEETGVTYSDNATKAHTVYSIKLDEWFVVADGKTLADCDLDGDGFLGYKDVQKYIKDNNITVTKPSDYEGIWKNPHGREAKFVRGSVFSGKFVIPFEKVKDQAVNTLQLQLLAADGIILKYWNINAATTHTTKTDTDEDWEKTDASKSVYNIYRNHMYNVGMKADSNPTDPDKPVDPDKPDPENPDPDKEEPEDLSKGQDLIIQVNDNWELIHDMELD